MELDSIYSIQKTWVEIFIDKLLPKAGDSTVNVFGWGLTQLMVTPKDITKTEFQPDDYPFAGSLYVSHTLYSYNPVEKYDFQTEITDCP